MSTAVGAPFVTDSTSVSQLKFPDHEVLFYTFTEEFFGEITSKTPGY